MTLATDVYAASLDPQPILLLRTPYDKSASAERGWLLAAQRGAAVVIQDTRGQGASIGIAFPPTKGRLWLHRPTSPIASRT